MAPKSRITLMLNLWVRLNKQPFGYPREHFFRINRQYLARLEAIQDIITYSNSRLRVVLLHGDDPDILISREKVSDFKGWLDS
jgi:DNA-binding LytR/AlgR family response regulator